MLSRVSHGVSLAARAVLTARPAAALHTTSQLAAKKMVTKDLERLAVELKRNKYVFASEQAMNKDVEHLRDQLIRHLSGRVDLRVFEDVQVKYNGSEHQLSHLARVSLRSPHMVAINFAAQPAAIKSASAALQMAMSCAPQQDGVYLYVEVPKMTRKRRERLADGKAREILGKFKDTINQHYTRSTKEAERISKADMRSRTNRSLLSLKRRMVDLGESLVEEKVQTLLKELK